MENIWPWTRKKVYYLVIHLLRAVTYIDHDAKGFAQILNGFCFPGTSRPSWCPTHDMVERLGQSDVTSVGQSEQGLQ